VRFKKTFSLFSVKQQLIFCGKLQIVQAANISDYLLFDHIVNIVYIVVHLKTFGKVSFW